MTPFVIAIGALLFSVATFVATVAPLVLEEIRSARREKRLQAELDRATTRERGHLRVVQGGRR